ncbi:MAG: hypothetical protein H0X43_05650 [Nitrosospira sp.]|nr:hypothetical protein [Nitrosospira sp.]
MSKDNALALKNRELLHEASCMAGARAIDIMEFLNRSTLIMRGQQLERGVDLLIVKGYGRKQEISP